MVGANEQMCNEKVERLKASIPRAFEGTGFTLSSGNQAAEPSAAAAREARLKRFGGGTTSSPPASAPVLDSAVAMEKDGDEAPDAEEDDDILKQAIAMSMSSNTEPDEMNTESVATNCEGGRGNATEIETSEGKSADQGKSSQVAAMELPPVNTALLAEVTSMGFPELRVRKALMAGSSNADAVINWVLEHGDDSGIDDPIAPVPSGGGTQKSWKCDETGKLFRSMEEVQMYAEKTGRTAFSESTEEKKPLSPEEIAAKKEALREKIASRRIEREQVGRSRVFVSCDVCYDFLFYR